VSRWKYTDTQPAILQDLDVILEEGTEFDAPDDWLPEPYPHPVYVRVDVVDPAPAAAPQE